MNFITMMIFTVSESDTPRPLLCTQFVLKPEPYSFTNVKTVHEELAKAMTAILKPSTDFLTSNKLLKVIHLSKGNQQKLIKGDL